MDMYKVDLNSDLGESFGRYTLGMDEKIIPLISSANIACGFHASDPVVMMESVSRTKAAGIRIGAHPGFPDLMGFGRRNMAVGLPGPDGIRTQKYGCFPGGGKGVYTVPDQRSGRYVSGSGDEAAACETTRGNVQYGGERL